MRSFAADLGRAAAEKQAWSPGPALRAVGNWMRPGVGVRALGQTAAGAGAGLGKAYLEDRLGALDPNMSPEGRAWHYGLNIAGGAAVGNPALRNALFTKRTTLSVPGSPGGTISEIKPRMGNIFGFASGYASLPYTANLLDASRKFARGAQQALGSPDFQQAISDPAGYGKQLAGEAARSYGQTPAAREGAHAFMGTVANNLTAGVGGGLAGRALGGIAGHFLAGDDERLSYEQRRRRERMRSILGLGGAIAGSVASPILMSRYAPNMIPDMLSKATGVAQ